MTYREDFTLPAEIMEQVQARGENLDELGKMWGFTYWSIDKAKHILGYAPQYNFPQYLAAQSSPHFQF